MCSNKIFDFDKISWKIWSVLMVFLSPGKSYVFLRNFEKAILEILMCSSTYCLSWKIYVFLYHFWFSWKKMVCFYKRVMSSPGKFMCSYYIQASWKIWCVLEISLKKSLLEEKNRYFIKIARRLLLEAAKGGVLQLLYWDKFLPRKILFASIREIKSSGKKSQIFFFWKNLCYTVS